MAQRIQMMTADLEVLEQLTRVYSEVAARRMQQVRQSVLQSRDFLSGVREIFNEVNASYRREIIKIARGRAGEKFTFLSHNGKVAAVFLSANTGLYGDIIKRTFDAFVDDVRLSEAEMTIIGRLGRVMYLSSGILRPHTYFDLPDWQTTADDLRAIIEHLVQYEEIHLYHGRFDSIVKQVPNKYVISSGSDLNQAVATTQYLFEPSLEEIMVVFERQIFAAMLDQVVRESQLSKFASRMLSMDRAGENIKKLLRELDIEWQRNARVLENKKQQEQLTGVWARQKLASSHLGGQARRGAAALT